MLKGITHPPLSSEDSENSVRGVLMNLYHRGKYGPPSRGNWTRGAIAYGWGEGGGGKRRVCTKNLRKPIAIPLPPPSMDSPMLISWKNPFQI